MNQETANYIMQRMSTYLDNSQMIKLKDTLDESLRQSEDAILEKSSQELLDMFLAKKNLSLNEVDVVEWCKSKIMSKKAEISKQGKNWYICIEGCIITVNASSYTIITAHKEKR